MTAKTVVTPTEGPFAGDGAAVFDRFGYAAAVEANGMLYVSGQIGLNPDGSMPDSDEAQFANAFDRLDAILKAAGAGFADIVDLTSYHVGIQDHFGEFVAVKGRYIPEPFPAWTAIGVQGLARPGLVIEIKAVALLP
jgi:enamine deaminase RidA (YjgF/YER057c/UK114 family)